MRYGAFRKLRRPILLAVLVCGVLWPPQRASSGSASPDDSVRITPRIILVGLDGADWLAIDPLIADGKLPAFSRLKALGRTGIMRATPPLVSPMIWTTIATGVEPENHGILDFMQDVAGGGQVPVGSHERLAPALWNLFSDAGRRVAIVGWWATWPAEQVRGTMVSDALAPQLIRNTRNTDAGLVAPAGALPRVSAAVVRAASLTRDDLAAYVPITPAEFEGASGALAQPGGRFYQDRLAHLAASVASTRTYAAVAEALLREEHPGLLAVYLETIDTVSHLFVADRRRGPPAIERAYRDADTLLRRLAQASPPDTLIIVCSDHGFYPASSGIQEDPTNLTGPATAWHRPYGIVGVATAAALIGTREGATRAGPSDVGMVTPLDIAPTLLHAAGLPVPTDMPGRVVLALIPTEAAARPVSRVAPPKFTRPPALRLARHDDAETLARLQALGYVGAAKTSLGRLNLAESLFRRGKLDEAERELRAVLIQQPSNLSAVLWLAQILERQNRPAEALAAYARAVKLPGGAKEALVPATDLAIRTGEVAAARRTIEAATSSADAAAAASVARGAVSEAEHDRPGAERAYRSALARDPLAFEAAARLQDLLVSAGRGREALASIQHTVELCPDSPRHLALLGQAYLAVRDGARAELSLRRALRLAPEGNATRLALGRALLVQKKFREAVEALLPSGDSGERDVLLGAAYSGLGDWTHASARLEAAIAAGQATPDVLNSLGWAKLQLGSRAEAAALLRRSLDADPRQPEIRRLLAEIRARQPGTQP
jgi:tetratricopeptide (TPR) repeat protein